MIRKNKKTGKNKKTLIVICGLPGTGKSFVAKKLGKKIKAKVLNTDVVRKKLFKKPTYSDEEKYKVYKKLFEIAEKSLKKSNVILDGTFYKENLRKMAKKIAEKNDSKFILVEVICEENLVKQRLEKRIKREEVSDADFFVHKKLRNEFEKIKEKHFVIKNDKNVEKQINEFVEKLTQ